METFYCPICATEFNGAIKEQHELAHGQVRSDPLETVFTAQDGIFWLLCIALGVIAGLFVASL